MAIQKPTGKKALSQKTFMDDVRTLGFQWKQKLLNVAQNWEKFKDILQNNYDLGREHLARGNTKDAVFRFKFVTWLDPKYKDVWYYLGVSEMADGNISGARTALNKALKLRPESDEARYMLAIVTGKATPKTDLPKTIPTQLLLEQFEALAPTFTEDQLSTYKYEGHSHLSNAIRSTLTLGRMDHIVLELGVGTGLCGPLLRDVAANLSGVDISPAMLAEALKVVDARGAKIYDSLICREAQAFITDGPDGSYDVVMGAGLVSYLGELQNFFEQSARILKPGGLLAFTADSFEGNGFQFDPETGRFRYTQHYLADLAARFGLTEVRCRAATMYPESAGWLCVYRK